MPLVRSVGVRYQVAPSNRSAARVLDARRLGARERMAADEPLEVRVRRARDARAPSSTARFVEPTSRDDAVAAALERRARDVRRPRPPGAQTKQTLRAVERLVDRLARGSSIAPSSSARSSARRIGSQPAHLAPSMRSPRGEADRAADQADAEDGDRSRVRVGSERRQLLARRPRRRAAPARRSRANSSAGTACGPSQIAASGSWWTSTMIPSAPAAAAASDSGSTRSRRPAAWLGSTTTGRCESCFSTGIGHDVEREAGRGLERADPALAQDHVARCPP